MVERGTPGARAELQVFRSTVREQSSGTRTAQLLRANPPSGRGESSHGTEVSFVKQFNYL